MSELTGTILKKIRENRHIPLEQVASYTRIRLELLRDLEDEEFDSMASSAQKKGFIRLYTDFLNPSAEEIALYSNLPAETQVQKTEVPAAPNVEATAPLGSEVPEGALKPQVSDVRNTSEPAQKPVPEA
ncbi:MAG TPA: helix-turn-helix domain-containing protein, partial [Anaerolineaceae bacterium]|nr:helix-turn-helix domain-containing protein [Anaerolineaceae bacterium]